MSKQDPPVRIALQVQAHSCGYRTHVTSGARRMVNSPRSKMITGRAEAPI